MAGALIALCLAQYANTLGHPLLWDANGHVNNDPGIRSLRNVPSFFLETSSPAADHYRSFTYYRPALRVLLALEYFAFGPNALGYQLVNVLLHVAAVLATLLLVSALIGDRKVAFATAVLSAVSPARATTVNWVACHSTLLMAICCCLALYAYRRARHGWALAALAVGLLCREDAVLLPVCLVLCELLIPVTSGRRRVLKTLPYFAVVAVFLGVRFTMVGTPPAVARGLGALLNSAAVITARFLKLLVLPDAGIAVYPSQTFATLSSEVLVSYAVVAASLLALGVLWRLRPPLAFWFAWIFLWLSPSAYVGNLGRFLMGANWLYQASTGFFVLAATAVLRFRRGPVILASLACLQFAMTYRSSGYWDNGVTFFERAVEFAPQSTGFRYELARALAARGEHPRAISEFTRVVQEEPDHGPALNSLGSELAESGRDEEAVTYFARAAAVDPRDGRAQFNLGVLAVRRGRDDEAVPRLRSAVQFLPRMTEARVALGLALGRLGRPSEGIAQLAEALRVDAKLPGAHLALAQLLEEDGQPEKSVEHLQAVVRLVPDDAGVHNDLGITLARLGRLDEAIREFAESVRLAPDPAVQANLEQARRVKAGR